MKTKQTAIIWLQQALESSLSHEQKMEIEGLYQQALSMEKEQIMDAWWHGYEDAYDFASKTTSEQYYSETYLANEL